MKHKSLFIILGFIIVLSLISYLTVPSIVRNHLYSKAVEQDSIQNKMAALELYEKAAEWDHAEGAYKAGEILYGSYVETGDSIKLNEAIILFEKSSKKGYKEANYMLGKALVNKLDTTLIFPPLKKDCGSKDAEAKFFLGQLYMQYDVKQGINYLEIAAQKLGTANNLLYKLYSDQSLDNANLDKANQYLDKGAELGDLELQSILGHNYLNGTNGYNKDSEKGFQILHDCAIEGGTFAYTSLGWCYLNSVGTAQNFDDAVKWIKKGEEVGDPNAKYLLGICYGNGYGVIKDEQQAILLISEAANNGCADAINTLSQMKKHSRPMIVSRTQQKYQGQKEVRCDICGGSGYRHGVNMGLPVVGRDEWGHDIYRCDYCGGRGYTMQ